MDKEIIKVMLADLSEKKTLSKLVIYDEAPEDAQKVKIEMDISGDLYVSIRDDYFTALQYLRRELEENDIQIECNGAAMNVYPSPMQLSMGLGRTAYKLVYGTPGRNSDIVDIFECDESLVFTKIKQQSMFYDGWVKSIRGE